MFATGWLVGWLVSWLGLFVFLFLFVCLGGRGGGGGGGGGGLSCSLTPIQRLTTTPIRYYSSPSPPIPFPNQHLKTSDVDTGQKPASNSQACRQCSPHTRAERRNQNTLTRAINTRPSSHTVCASDKVLGKLACVRRNTLKETLHTLRCLGKGWRGERIQENEEMQKQRRARRTGEHRVGWLLACLTSQQHASVSQGRICSDNFTCCHTETEVADQTFHLTQSQYTDTGPTSPSADSIMPGAW